jgi:hypothetical protein
MYVPDDRYLTLCTFLFGFDSGTSADVLRPFSGWLLARNGGISNRTFVNLIATQVLGPDKGEADLHVLPADEDRRLAERLFELLDEFLDEELSALEPGAVRRKRFAGRQPLARAGDAVFDRRSDGVRDPVDLLDRALDAATEEDMVRALRGVLAATDGPGDARHPAWYLASARASAVAQLVRAGEATVGDAVGAVERAVALGEPCASLQALAELHFARGDYVGTRDAIARVPRGCHRSDRRFMWRFHLWSLRARACFELDLFAEGFRYAEQIVQKMAAAPWTPEPRNLRFVPPVATTEALLRLAGASDTAGSASRARWILRRMAEVAEPEEWLQPDLAEAVVRATR